MIIFSTSEPKTQQKHFSSMEGDCGHRGTSSSVEEVRSQKAVTHHSRARTDSTLSASSKEENQIWLRPELRASSLLIFTRNLPSRGTCTCRMNSG